MDPKLRSVSKVPPPYPLNEFKRETLLSVGRSLAAARFARRLTDFSGEEWERAFAEAIGASWTPSNVGLDDVQLSNCCWGAKTVKAIRPHSQKSVRLISGRNSPDFSYEESDVRKIRTADLGKIVLSIWNERVGYVRARFNHARTIVLIKGPGLLSATVFELETVLYHAEEYQWSWNPRRNLVAKDSKGRLKFTWQPHGSQFTISEDVPEQRHCITIAPPKPVRNVTAKELLELFEFDDSWIQIKS